MKSCRNFRRLRNNLTQEGKLRLLVGCELDAKQVDIRGLLERVLADVGPGPDFLELEGVRALRQGVGFGETLALGVLDDVRLRALVSQRRRTYI